MSNIRNALLSLLCGREGVQEMSNGVPSSLQDLFSIHFPIIHQLIIVVAIIVAALVGLRFIKYYFSRLAQRNILSAKLSEQMYTPIEAIVSAITLISILYVITQIRELIYIVIILIAALLFSNWRVLADITAYYLIVSQYNVRSGDIIDVPSLGVKGKVTRLTTLAVIVRTNEGSTIIIPNSLLLSSPIRHLSANQTRILLQITLNLPRGMENAMMVLGEIENKLREMLVAKKLVHRPHDIDVAITSLESSRATFTVSIPIPGTETRHYNVNMIAKILASELGSYDPRIIVKGYEV